MLNPLANPNAVAQGPNRLTGIRLCRDKQDLSKAFELTFSSYFEAGLVADNPSGLRLTPYHMLSDSEVIIAEVDDTVVSTISMFGDGELGLPMQSMYSREIDSLRNQGLRLAEIGSLADRRTSPRRFITTFAKMGRLLVQVASARNIDALVAVAHPKHAKLYKRVLGFKQVGDHTDCPYANGNPAEALYLRFDDYLGTDLHDRFLGTSLPTSHLMPYDWDAETRAYFARILDCDAKIANTVGIENYFDWGVTPETTPLDVTASLGFPTF